MTCWMLSPADLRSQPVVAFTTWPERSTAAAAKTADAARAAAARTAASRRETCGNVVGAETIVDLPWMLVAPKVRRPCWRADNTGVTAALQGGIERRQARRSSAAPHRTRWRGRRGDPSTELDAC